MNLDNVDYNELSIIGKLVLWCKKNAKDIIIALLISCGVFAAAFIFLGFAKYGLGVPYYYTGGDDITVISTAKTINDRGWFWFIDRMAAPFQGGMNLDFSANLLQNADRFIMLVISMFTDDPIVIVNMTFLIIFPLCALNSYIVMRTIKLGRVLSSFGSCIFTLTPYIFYRSTSHLCLAFCIFVPFSILLCIWANDESDPRYMMPGKSFFTRKNIASILMCLLIANNGIGYYPIFTCFLLVVVMLCRIFRSRSFKSAVPAIMLVLFIILFFALAIAPHLIYITFTSGNSTAIRNISDVEIYSLNISQLFIPINGHGIPIVEALINRYNSNMLNINENQGSYLGIAGIIGFLLSLLVMFTKNTGDKKHDRELVLMSRLNICALLLAATGGFSALVGLVFSMIRGYNRISIFISFISILTLCMVMQKYADRPGTFSTTTKKAVSGICGAAFAVLCLADLLPTYGARDAIFESNRAQVESDRAFVKEIERELPEYSMVFQLPYHGTPECGPVNNMADYHLYIGQIFSDELRWSYGSPKGGSVDQWEKTVSALPTAEMINTICKADFNGIYIDNRAYTSDELSQLRGQIENVIGTPMMQSANGNLSFISLVEYKEQNDIRRDSSVLDINNLSVSYEFDYNSLYSTGEQEEYPDIILAPSDIQYGPYCTLMEGQYKVTVTGSNLNNADFDISMSQGMQTLNPEAEYRDENTIVYSFTLDVMTESVEFRVENNSTEDISVISVRVEQAA